MPNLKAPISLKKICVKNVAKNMDKMWSANYRENYVEKSAGKFSFIEGPFNALGTECIKEMMKQLKASEKMTKIYLHLLIVPNLKEIDFSGSTKLITDEIVDLVCIRCRGVTKLEMDHCDRVTSGALIRLVQSFHKTLYTVSFAGNRVTDDVLETMGRSCENLEILIVDMCKFTRNGIERLVYENTNKNLTLVGKNLRALRMMGCSFQDDVDFVSDILQHCPSLRCVTHFSLWEGIVNICKGKSSPPALKLTGVRYDAPIDLWALRDHVDTIPRIPKCIPEIMHLSIHDVDTMEMSLFHLLTGCCKTLKSLILDWPFPYDFFHFIGALCPELDTFSVVIFDPPDDLDQFLSVRQAFEHFISIQNLKLQNPHPWRNLRQLTISYPTSPMPLVRSSSILLDIFKHAATTLTHIQLQWMPDPDIDSLLSRALDSKYFENLESLSVDESVHLTSKPIWDLILTAPRLKSISFGGCRQVDFSEFANILDFVQENNYDIEIDDNYY